MATSHTPSTLAEYLRANSYARVPKEERQEEEEAEELEEELLEEEIEEGEGIARPAVAAAPAEWGWLPAAALIPCVVVMFLLSFMSLELLRTMWGYKQPTTPAGVMVNGVANLSGREVPD